MKALILFNIANETNDRVLKNELRTNFTEWCSKYHKNISHTNEWLDSEIEIKIKEKI